MAGVRGRVTILGLLLCHHALVSRLANVKILLLAASGVKGRKNTLCLGGFFKKLWRGVVSGLAESG